jgi:UDP-N-acetylmuramoylalanine--D-glutamate ligase
MQELANRRVLILGLGASGLAMARWCARAGAQVTVADTRQAPPHAGTLAQEWPAVQLRSGALDAALVATVQPEALLLSPGLSPAETAAAREAAQAHGAWIGGELALFAQALHALRAERAYAPQVLAVTGTNGKTTVTALTGELVARCGKRVAVAGNIGPTLLDTLAAHRDADDLPQVWVLELSSFQLEYPGAFEPTAATVLNLTQDHLDWHGSRGGNMGAAARGGV